MKTISRAVPTALLSGLLAMQAFGQGASPGGESNNGPVSITPISHASAILHWADEDIYLDPVGGGEAFEGQPAPDMILLTDIHGDHLDADTLTAVLEDDTTLIAPPAVVEALPEELADRVQVLENDEEVRESGLTITALPMYNLPDQGVEIRHEKGRGNGYLLEREGYRVYIAGDTADIPEMRALENIDMALVPMNLPYTMSVERAADAVLDFAPRRVYPYHYRGPDGLANLSLFNQLVRAGNEDIEVVLLDWYSD